MTLLLLSLAGGLGATLRFVTDATVVGRVRTAMPVGTLTVNILGSFLLGLVTGAVTRAAFPEPAAAIVGTGFCGGFTTFSTASVETARLWRADRPGLAVGYAAVDLAGSLLAALLGMTLAHL